MSTNLEPTEGNINASISPGLKRSSIDDFPVELQLQILCKLSNMTGLSALIHASPHCHQIYLSFRDEILPIIVLRELEARDIRLGKECSFLEYQLPIAAQKLPSRPASIPHAQKKRRC